MREWALIHNGAFIVVAGIIYFLVPNNLATGEVSGLASANIVKEWNKILQYL